MHGFYTEYRTLPPGVSLSHDLAQHIYMRGAKSCVIVVTDKPHDLAAITKKQWNILIRNVERQRASTLKAARIAELSNQIGWMQDLRFIINLPKELKDNNLVFASVDELIERPPVCSVMYVTVVPTDEDELSQLKNIVTETGILIEYRY